MSTIQLIVEYRSVPGKPGYRAGDDGSVWTCWERCGIRGRRPQPGDSLWKEGDTWRLIKQIYKKSKHRYAVELSGKTFFVHQVILLAFVGPCPPGMECCHGDGNSLNNRRDNLRWDTKEANARDRDRHGTTARGVRVGGAKLTDETAKAIDAEYCVGLITQRELAKKYGITQSSVWAVLHGKTWAHVNQRVADQPLGSSPEEAALQIQVQYDGPCPA